MTVQVGASGENPLQKAGLNRDLQMEMSASSLQDIRGLLIAFPLDGIEHT